MFIIDSLLCHIVEQFARKLLGESEIEAVLMRVGSIDAGRGSDDCHTDVGCGPWPRGKCEGSDGRYVVLHDWLLYFV